MVAKEVDLFTAVNVIDAIPLLFVSNAVREGGKTSGFGFEVRAVNIGACIRFTSVLSEVKTVSKL